MTPIRSYGLPSLPPMPKPPEALRFPAADQASPVDKGNPFLEMLVGKVEDVNSMQLGADQMVHQMLTGEDVNQAEVLTAVQKADLAFRMMLQMRNKLIDAYQQVQQIQI